MQLLGFQASPVYIVQRGVEWSQEWQQINWRHIKLNPLYIVFLGSLVCPIPSVWNHYIFISNYPLQSLMEKSYMQYFLIKGNRL